MRISDWSSDVCSSDLLDLSQTVPLFARALDFVSQTVSHGGKVLFVVTKRQAQDPIAEAARKSGQHFVTHRWLGGMLTNWKTISQSIKRFNALEEHLSGDTHGLTKKTLLQLNLKRPEDRRVGKACVRRFGSRRSPKY